MKLILCILSLLTGLSVTYASTSYLQSNAYVIGSFNEWKLPTEDALNGAYELQKKENGNYVGCVSLSEGDEFVIYATDSNGESIFSGCNTFLSSPYLYLVKYSYEDSVGKVQNVNELSLRMNPVGNLTDAVPFIIKSKGGDNMIFTLTDIPYFLNIEGTSFEEYKNLVNTVDCHYKIDDGDWMIMKLPIRTYQGIETSFFLRGKSIQFFVSENATDNVNDQRWGGSPFEEEWVASTGVDGQFFTTPIVADGDPIRMEFEDYGLMDITYSLPRRSLQVIAFNTPRPILYEANVSEDGIERTFDLDVEAGNWSEMMLYGQTISFAIVGESGNPDSAQSVNYGLLLHDQNGNLRVLDQGEDYIVVPIIESKEPVEWEFEEQVEVKVILDWATYRATIISSEINRIAGLNEVILESDLPVEYYNLQGVRVMNPMNGIFIEKRGGKTRKIIF